MDYLLHILILISIYVILSDSFDLIAGHMGILSLTQAGFYGIGAYTSALVAIHFRTSFVVSTFGAMVVAAVISFLVSVPSLRLSDDYLVITTFGFQMIVFSVLNNWMGLTHGPLGLPGVPRPVLFGHSINTNIKFFFLAVAAAAFADLIVHQLTASPFGRVLHAIREDEGFAQSLGKNTISFKLIAFAISAALAGMAGSLYAGYATYIDPSSFTVTESILIISMVIIGGAGSRWGPLAGAVVLVLLPEVMRFIGLPNAVTAQLQQIIYGAMLTILMLFRPTGLMGRYGFDR